MAALTAAPAIGKPTGFTLVELVTVIAIVAVLAALALPSMRELILSQYVRGGASDLQTALYFARSEALKRAACVSVVPGSSAWENGWTVNAESAAGACDGGGAVLRRQNALSSQLSTMSGSTITYRLDGRVTAAPSNIVFRTSNAKVTARCVAVDLSGRPSVIYDTDGNPSNGCN